MAIDFKESETMCARGMLWLGPFFALVLVAMNATAQVRSNSVPNLVAWWEAEGNAGDSVGNSNGTLTNGAAFANGRIGQAFLFDGVDDYVTLSPGSNMDFGAGDFSLSVWVNLTTLGGGQTSEGIRTILHKVVGTAPVDAKTYFLEYLTQAFSPNPSALRFAIGENGLLQNDLRVSAPLTAGQWHHIAAVRQGSTNSIYLDGALLGSQTAGSNVDTGTGGNARIGNIAPNGVLLSRQVEGLIDETALYDRALCADEIRLLAGAQPATYCTAKINSCGTLPAVSSTGIPRASTTSGFTISASNAKTSKFGLLIYTDQGRRTPAAPFQGGWLCLSSPVKRGPAAQSVGGMPGQCDATFGLDMNCFAAGLCGGNPQSYLSTPGTAVDCQWWGRDTVTHGSYLSDAIEYVVCP